MYSYVCVLSTNNYLDGVLVLNENLKQLNSKYPLLCLINENINEETRNILESFNIDYKEFNSILPSSIDNSIRWKYTLDKLNIFKLIEYDKLVYLDSDFLLLENLDHLFSIDDFSMVFDNKEDSYCSALMVLKPNLLDYNNLLDTMKKMDEDESIKLFGDQDVINRYFNNINELPIEYNFIKGIENNLIDVYDYIKKEKVKKYECKDYYYSDNPKIIHYFGDIKPFMIDKDFNDTYCYLYFYYLEIIRKKK